MDTQDQNSPQNTGGRPSLYGEPTEDVSVRVPVSLLKFITATTDYGKAPGIREFAIRQARANGYEGPVLE